MIKEIIVQFVCFEIAGENNEFISQWDQYTKGMSDSHEIILQQEIGNKKRTRYLSQHRCQADEFKFVFKKERRSAHFPEMEIKVRQLGGYTELEVQCKHETGEDESKIFLFITDPRTNIDEFRLLTNYHFLNTYKAYYESSSYEYILEFYVDNNQAEELMLQLKSQGRSFELGQYKESLLQGA